MNQALQQIERTPIKVTTSQQLDPALADECAEVLGYRRMAEERQEPLEPLAAALAELELEVLNIHQVKSYQLTVWKEKVEAEVREWLSKAVMGDRLPDLPTWSQRKIEDYTEPIPEFVLRKAVAIKRKLPEAVIFVEALENYPDPFLVVATRKHGYSYVNQEEYYVDCWAEPKFEGSL
jgi:hypothetical protein